jgi:hypothetical protein
LASAKAAAQAPPAAPEKIAVGDWQLSPTMEIRIRGEYRRDPPDQGGLDFTSRPTPRIRDSWAVMSRARLGIGVERGAVKAQLTLQDARAFGSPSPTATFGGTRGIGRFEPYEAYLEMHSSSARPTYLKLGRQAVVWGEGRLVGNADFSPVGRALDAARGHFALGNFDFEALAAILELPGPLGTSFADTTGPARSGTQLYGLLVRWTIDPLLRIETYGLARIARSAGLDLDGSRFQLARFSGELVTAALRVSGDRSGWNYGAEGAYQLGRVPLGPTGEESVSAWAAAGHVQKTLDQIALSPTLRIAGSYASGDDGNGTYKQFDPLLADPQRFHGQMDLFAWSNAIDASFRAQIVPLAETTFAVEYRYARLAETRGEWIGAYMNAIGRGAAPGEARSAELGHEIDAVFTYRPWVPLEIRAGYSLLFMGDGARSVMSSMARGKRELDGAIYAEPLAHYAYTQATLSMP